MLIEEWLPRHGERTVHVCISFIFQTLQECRLASIGCGPCVAFRNCLGVVVSLATLHLLLDQDFPQRVEALFFFCLSVDERPFQASDARAIVNISDAVHGAAAAAADIVAFFFHPRLYSQHG